MVNTYLDTRVEDTEGFDINSHFVGVGDVDQYNIIIIIILKKKPECGRTTCRKIVLTHAPHPKRDVLYVGNNCY